VRRSEKLSGRRARAIGNPARDLTLLVAEVVAITKK